MSFLFGKSKKHQSTALPPATRDITSSGGPPPVSSIPLANGQVAQRDAEKGRPGRPGQTGTPSSSVNNSLSSLQGGLPLNAASPEPKMLRERADSDLQSARAGPQQGPRPSNDSPYPWSQRRLNLVNNASPFPRYGAAVNATASKDGMIYMMGGLVNGSMVKGDLWLADANSPSMQCFSVPTTGDGPGPRVGHSSLLVGNAFIVFGGDTKSDDGDVLDDTLYLLNTSTKHWSRASPTGPKPPGRYGHTLNILGSKLYVFGGQVESYFFNDLAAFDLNSLQSTTSKWELLIPNSKDIASMPNPPAVPAARTNHSVITWNDKLYLFGGTDGFTWFNDVWTYDSRTNAWTELDCIGYIPVAREGHAAALVNDTMYIFGGRTKDAVDLSDLAAFRISSRRWYKFQNMGPSPSGRSGHSMTAFGKQIFVLGGEPSSSVSDRNELSLAFCLDTSKIRYPASEAPQQIQPTGRRPSGEKTGIPQSRTGAPPARDGATPTGQIYARPMDPPAAVNNLPQGSRLPRVTPAPSGPPPQQQPPQPKINGTPLGPAKDQRSKTPTKNERGVGSIDLPRAGLERAISPILQDNLAQGVAQSPPKSTNPQSKPITTPKESFDIQRAGNMPSRNTSRSTRQQHSQDSIEHETPRPSIENHRATSRQADQRLVDSGMGSSPPVAQNDELVKELESAKSRNAWYASELALARKAGYLPQSSQNPLLDERAAEAFGDDDRPLLEALLKMRSELSKVQGSIETQAVSAANKIAEVERQRDAAINEAVYAKAKLAAHGGGGGSHGGTPQPDERGTATPDMDRVSDMHRRLASTLTAHKDISTKLDRLSNEVEAEKRARQLAEDTAEAAQKRVDELDLYRQRNGSEVEGLRAELHEAQRVVREEAANSSEALAQSKLLAIDKNELSSKLAKLLEDAKSHSTVLQSLRDALAASSDKSTLFEQRLEEERSQRHIAEQKLTQLKAEHENNTSALESTTRRLRDAEELAEKNATEARVHREAVLSGLSRSVTTDSDEHEAADERVTILQQQLESATTMIRRNQTAADTASEKLRRAEERIAGLEAYQEQTSRESLMIRKQLQSSMKDSQLVHAEKAELQQAMERHRLDSNALEVQLKTLKNLLEERGVNPVDARRSRVLDSPGSRFGTPELNRMRELEQQLDVSVRSREELISSFEQREVEVSKEWEAKLIALSNDHRAAVDYLRGSEKMLAKMNRELERYKVTIVKMEGELNQAKETAQQAPSKEVLAVWDSERSSLKSEVNALEEKLKKSISSLEARITSGQKELEAVRYDRDLAAQNVKGLEAANQKTRTDFDVLRQENTLLEERAQSAEQRVQMFLDQFESSVDNYRRQSRVPPGASRGVNGAGAGLRPGHESISGDSIYSRNEDDDISVVDDDATPDASILAKDGVSRNSVALDNLASELDALRSHWESTNKAYRLSDRFDFEKTDTTDKEVLSDSLAAWRKRMDFEQEQAESGESHQNGNFVSSAQPAPTQQKPLANSAK